MSKAKLINNFEHLTETDLDSTAAAGILGTTGNANFVFVKNELTNVTTSSINFHNSLAAVIIGNNESVTYKNKCLNILLTDMTVITLQINVLANGDLGKLQSSGFPLVKEAVYTPMGKVINFKQEHGALVGSIFLKVDKPAYTNHGVVFAFWNPIYGVAPLSPDNWFHRSCNGHSLTITGLVVGTAYPFTAAYKGSDDAALVWCPVITKTAAD